MKIILRLLKNKSLFRHDQFTSSLISMKGYASVWQYNYTKRPNIGSWFQHNTPNPVMSHSLQRSKAFKPRGHSFSMTKWLFKSETKFKRDFVSIIVAPRESSRSELREVRSLPSIRRKKNILPQSTHTFLYITRICFCYTEHPSRCWLTRNKVSCLFFPGRYICYKESNKRSEFIK